MNEWWQSHFKLLIASGLAKTDLADVVDNGLLQFRAGVGEFLHLLNKNKIPLIVMSASGVGELLPMFFAKHNLLLDNIYFVINKFNWNEAGRAISFQEPIIHGYNKDETLLEKIPEIYAKIANRTNVVLLGDSLGDLGMVSGFDYRQLIRIGFLLSDDQTNIKSFKENFDFILSDQEDFYTINQLIKELLP